MKPKGPKGCCKACSGHLQRAAIYTAADHTSQTCRVHVACCSLVISSTLEMLCQCNWLST